MNKWENGETSDFNGELIFPARLFGEGRYEQENLISVGPINPVGKTLIGRKYD